MAHIYTFSVMDPARKHMTGHLELGRACSPSLTEVVSMLIALVPKHTACRLLNDTIVAYAVLCMHDISYLGMFS